VRGRSCRDAFRNGRRCGACGLEGNVPSAPGRRRAPPAGTMTRREELADGAGLGRPLSNQRHARSLSSEARPAPENATTERREAPAPRKCGAARQDTGSAFRRSVPPHDRGDPSPQKRDKATAPPAPQRTGAMTHARAAPNTSQNGAHLTCRPARFPMEQPLPPKRLVQDAQLARRASKKLGPKPLHKTANWGRASVHAKANP
jgi:hypothetical protein